MFRTTILVTSWVILLFLPLKSTAQDAPTSDPHAASIASQAVAVLTGGNAIADVTLTGSATWNGTATGTAMFRAAGIGASRIDLTFANTSQTEIRTNQTGIPVGQIVTPNGTASFAYHNCWTDPSWFFPQLGYLTSTGSTVFTYVGQETRNGIIVQHIQAYSLAEPILSQAGSHLSNTDFYLDATTLLPTALTFNTHPDNDAASNLLVEIRFSNYQTFGEASIPMHVQRYQQGTLMLDVALTSVLLNSGIPTSVFAIN